MATDLRLALTVLLAGAGRSIGAVRLANDGRMASDPVNAGLNLAYGLLQSATTVALEAVGLDAGMGFLHRDGPSRPAAALDCMEPARAAADELVLDWLGGHILARKDLVELPSGATRIAPPLASALIGSWAPQLAEAVGPIAEHVAAMVASEAGLGKQPTLLTQRARSAAGRVRQTRRRRSAVPNPTQGPPPKQLLVRFRIMYS